MSMDQKMPEDLFALLDQSTKENQELWRQVAELEQALAERSEHLSRTAQPLSGDALPQRVEEPRWKKRADQLLAQISSSEAHWPEQRIPTANEVLRSEENVLIKDLPQRISRLTKSMFEQANEALVDRQEQQLAVFCARRVLSQILGGKANKPLDEATNMFNRRRKRKQPGTNRKLWHGASILYCIFESVSGARELPLVCDLSTDLYYYLGDHHLKMAPYLIQELSASHFNLSGRKTTRLSYRDMIYELLDKKVSLYGIDMMLCFHHDIVANPWLFIDALQKKNPSRDEKRMLEENKNFNFDRERILRDQRPFDVESALNISDASQYETALPHRDFAIFGKVQLAFDLLHPTASTRKIAEDWCSNPHNIRHAANAIGISINSQEPEFTLRMFAPVRFREKRKTTDPYILPSLNFGDLGPGLDDHSVMLIIAVGQISPMNGFCQYIESGQWVCTQGDRPLVLPYTGSGTDVVIQGAFELSRSYSMPN